MLMPFLVVGATFISALYYSVGGFAGMSFFSSLGLVPLLCLSSVGEEHIQKYCLCFRTYGCLA